MTNILTKAVNRVMALWGVAPDQPFIGDEPLSGMDLPKSDAVTFIKEIPALRKVAGLREDSGGPPDNIMFVTQINFGGVIFPGTYRTRSGQRVLYSGKGAGRFLPYGLETGGWNPATGRWLTSGEDHIWDLVERVEQGEGE